MINETLELNEGSLDLFYAYKIIKFLSTPWEEWEAYKLGLISIEGKTIKKPKSSKEKDAFTKLIVVARNLKLVLDKLPFGKSKLGSFAAAMLLLKEDVQKTGKELELLMNEARLQDFEGDTVSILGAGTYTIDDSVFLNLKECSCMFKVSNPLHSDLTLLGENIFRLQDIVTREYFMIPFSLLEKQHENT